MRVEDKSIHYNKKSNQNDAWYAFVFENMYENVMNSALVICTNIFYLLFIVILSDLIYKSSDEKLSLSLSQILYWDLVSGLRVRL